MRETKWRSEDVESPSFLCVPILSSRNSSAPISTREGDSQETTFLGIQTGIQRGSTESVRGIPRTQRPTKGWVSYTRRRDSRRTLRVWTTDSLTRVRNRPPTLRLSTPTMEGHSICESDYSTVGWEDLRQDKHGHDNPIHGRGSDTVDSQTRLNDFFENVLTETRQSALHCGYTIHQF